ncbi:MAG: EAL domain-containing protein [Gammaproteobacteria bacterium]|nr:EAL domain-containing protein [Gammaproteobacteria bacterium]
MKISERQSSFLYGSFLTIVLVVGGFFLSKSSTLERLDLVLYDVFLPLQNNHMSQQVAVVAVDDVSIQALGRWPWPRRYHAQLLDRLTAMGARSVGIDMIFSEAQKDDPDADLLFTQALTRNGKTVLPVAPMQLTPLDPITEILPIVEFASAASAIGHVDVELDIDGLCRRFFLYAGLGDAHWPAFSLAMIQAGGDKIEIEANKIVLKNTSTSWLRQNAMMIPYAQRGEHPKIISYVDVLQDRVSKSDINNKYILVGATATGLGDVISTPASRSHERMPGVELNAHILNGLIQNINIYELSEQYQVALTTALIVLTCLFVLMLPLRSGLLTMIMALLIILAVSITFMVIWQLWFPPAVALLMSVLVWPLWSGWQLGVESRLRQKLLLRLENQALHHMATGLPNHYMLEDKLRLLNTDESLSSNMAALIVLHINWPGSASVVLGRPMADTTLKIISERLHAVVEGDNFIAHLNGDDFAILLTNLKDSITVKEAAINLLDKLQLPLVDGNQQFLLAPQIGVSTLTSGGDAGTLLRNAYAAMFKSRIDNAEHLCIYSADIGQQLEVRSQLEQALIYALERNEFEVYYQPQINAITGQIVGVEALLRWNNPILGWIGPDSFIPIAEHVGLIKNIGHWVLETACHQLNEWNVMGLGALRLAVNVSPLQFVDPTLHTKVRAIIGKTDIVANKLELEITESSLMFDLDNAVNIMSRIKQEGIELAIDDFGTGYSSLSNLRHFPLDRLKIDQAFTREIGKNSDATEITLTILAMAKHLNLDVIAEGIETNEQAEFLRKHGCDEFQGFLFSKAISAKDLTTLLKTGIDMSLF